MGVEVKVKVDLRRPSIHPVIDQIELSLDRHGYCDLTPQWVNQLLDEVGQRNPALLSRIAKERGWLIVSRPDWMGYTIRREGVKR